MSRFHLPLRPYINANITRQTICVACGCIVDSTKQQQHTQFHNELENLDSRVERDTQSTLPPF